MQARNQASYIPATIGQVRSVLLKKNFFTTMKNRNKTCIKPQHPYKDSV